MKAKLHARIGGLEQAYRAVLQTRKPADQGPSAVETIRSYLEACGIEQEGNESLAEAYARALGITSRELHARMSECAAGQRTGLL